jgi:hypothetical protein
MYQVFAGLLGALGFLCALIVCMGLAKIYFILKR